MAVASAHAAGLVALSGLGEERDAKLQPAEVQTISVQLLAPHRPPRTDAAVALPDARTPDPHTHPARHVEPAGVQKSPPPLPGNGARNRASEPQSSAVAPPAVAAPDAMHTPQSPQIREQEAPPRGHATAPAAPEAAAPAPAAAGESISARLPSGGTGAPSEPARYDAAYLENPSPQYPKLSRRRGEEGKVTLRVRVRADGRAENVEIAHTSGHPRLDAAARETVLSWRFVPARQGETPIDSSLLVPVVFRLDD